ncbi:hypothetical protein BHU72_11915 [Desulfuribacillus stibiiarsenatis]|uniref:Uncharacterized protein n=1 Tax=Desulfuribacillus stibiiarsenatis TaxID=1390249 RepID=A0A1E5L7W6_9FIRM|nr:hypothetical protein [Desulfuribacillus stibiiarsenatis]OEH86235.1 hypothetical protein BHU72_11915 [Desulfuribacillus stibiiarsenatis]
MKSITDLVKNAHITAVSKGWHEKEVSFGEIISLMHSELSEAVEEFRQGKDYQVIYWECKSKDVCPNRCDGVCALEYPADCINAKPCGIPIEFADTVIRVFDACGKYGIDLEKAIDIKMAYNIGRGYRHGGKVI